MKKFNEVTNYPCNSNISSKVGVSAEKLLSIINVMTGGTTGPVILEAKSMGEFQHKATNLLLNLKSAGYLEVTVLDMGVYLVTVTEAGLYKAE